MHQTTVRFSADVWKQLEREAASCGVSAAQYVRDAALARLAYTAGQRGDTFFGAPAQAEPRSAGAAAAARELKSASSAVWAQAQLARDRARVLRDDARSMQLRTTHARAERSDRTTQLRGGRPGSSATVTDAS